MTLTVRLFARARDLAGSEALLVTVPTSATVTELRMALADTCPALRDLLPRCAIALNDDFADDDVAVPLNAQVAVLPPVSGG
jgi:molybdopterin converting factor small subunit